MASWMTTWLGVTARSRAEIEAAGAAGAKLLAIASEDEGLAEAARGAGFATLAIARNAAEAMAAARAGAGWIVCPPDCAFSSGGGVQHVALIAAAQAEDAEMWAGLKGRGFTAATPEPGASGRLADAWSMAALSDFATRCRAAGLAFGFSGGLETPDAPRLIRMKPRWILFDEGLRGADGVLSSKRLAAAASLFHDEGEGARSRKTGERVFVRDLVVDMSIGVYDRERKRKQPARFTLEVELEPLDGPQSFADVFTYDVIIDHIRALAAHGHHDLVETLADDVARAALGHPRARSARVVVEKLAVIEGAVGVEVRREKEG